MQKQTPKIIYALSLASFIVATSAVMQVSAQEGPITDRVSIMVPSSCSMTSAVVSDHQADIVNGQYLDDIGITELNAFCNDQDGFSIYAVGYSSDEYGNNYLVDSASRANLNIPTGIATSGPSSNWAMKITLDDSNLSAASIVNGFDSYSAVPSSYTQVAKRESSTDTGALAQGVKFNTSYATFISSTQTAGTYQGKVKYTLVHPHSEIPARPIDTEGGRIAYYPNTNIYEGSMGQQVVQDTDTSITLLAPNFSRDGYGFAGWNTAYDYSGEFYGPNETITFTAGEYAEKGLSLYAVWIESEGFIQNWQGCSSMTIGDTTALTDERDNQTYAIAKLADGKCWTIEDLRLNPIDDQELLAFASQGVGPGFTNLPASSDSWDTNDKTLLQLNSNNISITNSSSEILINAPGYTNDSYTDDMIFSDIGESGSKYRWYSYGNYYSWAAAIADTMEHTNLATTTSICPAGWLLPSGSNDLSANYSFLIRSITGVSPNQNSGATNESYVGTDYSMLIRKYPNNFIYSGYWEGNYAWYRGRFGSYWTSTSVDAGDAYQLYIDESNVMPGNNSVAKFTGHAIRCVTNN